MTEEITYQIKLEKLKQEHEVKMEMLRWFTRNRQAPYILMMAGGVGFAYLAKIIAGAETSDQEKDDFLTGLQNAFKAAAPMAGVAGMLTYLTGTQDKSAVYEWTGAGIATIGVTCLLLDAAGGLKDVAKVV